MLEPTETKHKLPSAIFRQAVWDEPLLKELSGEGRAGYEVKPADEKAAKVVGEPWKDLPLRLVRKGLGLPELSEPQVVRHFVRLSQMNFGIDTGMYPLGSCTMKYNPKVSQRAVRNPKFSLAHPYLPTEASQGLLEILFDLQSMLCEITGMRRFSLLPAAGAQGEYVGALMIKSWIKNKGEEETRNEMLVPDSAHGTNPSSAAMAGFKVVKVPSNEDGIVGIEAVESLASKRTAGIMLTVPNTLGLFERNIVEVAGIIHDAGGLLYYDGANMNALLGKVRPGDMGFDVVHLNVHKTFATPHGGGGPGAGPVGVGRGLEEYLPIPYVDYNGINYFMNYSLPKTIGFIRGFNGSAGVLLRAYIYILLMGSDGLKKASELAVLASNYVLRKIDASSYSLPFDKKAPRKHEFVISASPLKKKTKKVSALEVSKAILDYGFHSPTTYFPLIADEALMVEPTETEPYENLDEYAKILNHLGNTAQLDPNSILSSPHNTSRGRLDEFRASHPSTLTVSWKNIPNGKEKNVEIGKKEG
jgi:glycine dehydrogenase subunit 2